MPFAKAWEIKKKLRNISGNRKIWIGKLALTLFVHKAEPKIWGGVPRFI